MTATATIENAAIAPRDGNDSGRRTLPRGMVVWFTGLSGAGKTTIARGVAEALGKTGLAIELLDGDEVRPHLSQGLGFSKADRDTNVKRVGYVAGLLARNGVLVLVSLVSPYRETRNDVRRIAGKAGAHFAEIFVNASVDLCETRDVKGLYRKARAGEIPNFTGVSDPYEAPHAPELVLSTGEEPVADSVSHVLDYLDEIVHWHTYRRQHA